MLRNFPGEQDQKNRSFRPVQDAARKDAVQDILHPPKRERASVEYDKDRVDEMVLALLYLTTTQDRYASRAWKGLDWAAMNQLHEKGYIGDPKEKSTSVVLTEAGAKLSRELFFKHFGLKE